MGKVWDAPGASGGMQEAPDERLYILVWALIRGLFSFVIDASASFVSFSSFLISAMHIEYSSSRRQAFMLH